ncbi:MAG: sterol desaturase family protein [Burkholderiales bacterium]|nr:MAG: sterol desaturase family protein [Burkholderiales bacterium]
MTDSFMGVKCSGQRSAYNSAVCIRARSACCLRSSFLMIDTVSQYFETLVGAVFSSVVEPTLFSLGLMSWVERGFEGTAFFVGGILQILAVVLLLWPLEKLMPAQRIDNPSNVRTDVIFTLVNKLGLLPLVAFALMFLALTPLDSWLRLQGYAPWSLEDFLPGLFASPAINLLLYILIIDLGEYWRHRLQHRIQWWWQLHSLHHAQRDMTFWTDDRNHILDEILGALWIATIALVIGVPPQQFPLVLFATKFIESLSHANLRWNFGVLKFVLVSPQFHRVHHAIGVGHEGDTQGKNFAVVFSFWDKLFATADFRDTYPATGVRDQITADRNYGTYFWETQWLGFKRLLGRA